MMEEYITFETAKMLKEAGYDVPCDAIFTEDGIEIIDVGRANYNGLYPDMVSRPTQEMAASWLRDRSKIHIYCFFCSDYWHVDNVFGYCIQSLERHEDIYSENSYTSYEEALEAGLQEAIGGIR